MHAAVLAEAVPETRLEQQDCRGFPEHLFDQDLDLEYAALLFDLEVQPAAQHHRTRASYYANWRSFVSYAYLHGALSTVLPATPHLVRAYMWTLLQLNYSAGSIMLHLYAIIDRHRRHHFQFPVAAHVVGQWIKAFKRICGAPRQDKLAITSTMIKAILKLPRASLRDVRDAAIVALGTVCALRVRELIELDLCDALFDMDAPGILTICVKVRKNDCGRSGLWPRCGSATDPDFNIPALLRLWIQRAGLRRHPACSKTQHPRSTCHACGRLFSRLQANVSAFPPGHAWHGATHATVTDAIRNRLRAINVDVSRFSGISMRAGGLTTALAGDVPKDLFTLQSGHVSDSWKHYVRGNQHMLLRFYESFGF